MIVILVAQLRFWSTVAFRGGKALGTYIQSGQNAIAQTAPA
ncbi:MAG: hypothetical protein RJB10_2049, partial [Pseudomonadota bacterium]